MIPKEQVKEIVHDAITAQPFIQVTQAEVESIAELVFVRLEAAHPGVQRTANETCEWKLEDDGEGVWYSACGDAWIFEEGTPTDNMMKYCPFCGRLLTQRVPDPPMAEEDDDSIVPAGW